MDKYTEMINAIRERNLKLLDVEKGGENDIYNNSQPIHQIVEINGLRDLKPAMIGKKLKVRNIQDEIDTHYQTVKENMQYIKSSLSHKATKEFMDIDESVANSMVNDLNIVNDKLLEAQAKTAFATYKKNLPKGEKSKYADFKEFMKNYAIDVEIAETAKQNAAVEAEKQKQNASANNQTDPNGPVDGKDK